MQGPSSFGDWTIYRQSETVTCPGTKTDRRRQTDRALAGDRRCEPRSYPCKHRWGRVTAGEWHVRQKRVDQAPWPGETVVLECPDCHCPIEFATVAARAA